MGINTIFKLNSLLVYSLLTIVYKVNNKKIWHVQKFTF